MTVTGPKCFFFEFLFYILILVKSFTKAITIPVPSAVLLMP